MDMRELRYVVASLFIMLNQTTYILFRIECLVVLVTVLFLAMFIMDIFRRHIHSPIIKAISSLFDAVSDSIVIYLLGAMQTAPFKNELFPVWALVLVIFRYSIDFISGYGVPDRGGRRFTEWRNVVKLLGSAFLNWTRGSRFSRPLWSLWAMQMLRSLYRFTSHYLAVLSTWQGRSSQVVAEYMRTYHDRSNWKPEECDPDTMVGYTYLVYGERVVLQKPRYVLHLDNNSHRSRRRNKPAQAEDTTASSMTIPKSSLITLEKIWKWLGPNNPSNLEAENFLVNDLRDLSLAFALSRLLRCRFEDIKLRGDIHSINRKLIKARIIQEKDDKRAFDIMELQVAFVHDYFNTRYPMVFWAGLGSLWFTILQSAVTIVIVCWLSVDIRKVYKPPDGELAHLVQGFNIDMTITWVFMLFMVFKEIWEMATYLVSDWTKLLLVCMYANSNNEDLVWSRCMASLTTFLFRSKINAKRWHGLIDQYTFVRSYDDIPKFWNLVHIVTTGMVPKRDDGSKLSSAIDIPECVRPAILEKLHAILDLEDHSSRYHGESYDGNVNYKEPVNMDYGPRQMPKIITTLSDSNSDRWNRYGWACFDLQTSSHVVLVWHIATNICEMALAKKHGVDLSKPGSLRSLLSFFTGCCSSKPYLIDVNGTKENKCMQGRGFRFNMQGLLCSVLPCFRNCCLSKLNEKGGKMTDELRKKYIVANSLSNYCGYVLVSRPDLIPDSFLVPNIVFQEAVKSARDDILKDCNSLESRYNKLIQEAGKASHDSESIKEGQDVVRQGAFLAKELLDNENDDGCWEILSGLWTELFIHLAPSWNAEAHKSCLESGGEFITNVWALLWQCGIEKSSLWPQEDVCEENHAPAAAQHAAGDGHRNIHPLEEMPHASTETSSHFGIEIHEEDSKEGSRGPGAGNV